MAGKPLGLWLQKSGLLHEGLTKALVVAVSSRCKHQELVLRCESVQRWSARVCRHSCT